MLGIKLNAGVALEMKIFLSWSGSTSHAIAEKLHRWLPMVIQRVEPYISTEIEKGTRWGTDIAEELEKCSFGIACVTAENKEAPWLLFEAGALSKSVTEGKLAPLLFGLEQTDIQKSPLTQFQMTKFEKTEFLKLLQSVNDTLESGLEPTLLNSLFDALWPQLDNDISAILKAVPKIAAPAQTLDAGKMMGAVEELLTNSRSVTQALSRPERLLPQDYLEYVLRRTGLGDRDERSSRVKLMVERSYHELMQARDTLADEQQAAFDRPLERIKEALYRLSDMRVGRPSFARPSRPVRILDEAVVEESSATSTPDDNAEAQPT